MQGKFLMVDGLDGSGKGVIVNAIKSHLIGKGMKVFDLRQFCKKNNYIPELDEIEEYDVIASAEPSHCLVGKAIREEIIKNNNREYSGRTAAYAFSIDREILYRKLIIPARKAGKIILQERGISTSLVYQPIQKEKISLKEIIDLPGNRLSLKNPPDVLAITKVDPLVVIERLKQRSKKQDDAIYENLSFQTKVKERFESEWLKKLFELSGSKVIYIDVNPPKTETDTENIALSLWEKELK